MIPRPEMIPKLGRKWSRTVNDPQCGPQMILQENENGMEFVLRVEILIFNINGNNYVITDHILYRYNSQDKIIRI